MVRNAIAVAIASLLGFFLAIISLGFAGLGKVDWNACIENSVNTTSMLPGRMVRVEDMPFSMQFNIFWQSGFRDGILQWSPISAPFLSFLGLLFTFVPAFWLSLTSAMAQSRSRAWLFAGATALLFYLVISMQLPVSALHDCDRKGSDSEFGFPINLILAAGLWFAASWLDKLWHRLRKAHSS